MEDTFPKRVYQLVARIPRGKVATYGQLALLAGSPRASRIVGAALAKAPAGLPCAFGGVNEQKLLLEAEGVPFLPDGRVDVKVCLWETPEDA